MNKFDMHKLAHLTLAQLRCMCVDCDNCNNCPFKDKYDGYICKIIQLYCSIGISILLQDLEKTTK